MERGCVVITGASSGIGEACALHLDHLGFQVFAGVRKMEDGLALARRAAEQGAATRLTPLIIDVTDGDSIAAAVRQVSEAAGELAFSGLVNNAGIAVAGPVEFVPVEELRRQFDINVTGQMAVTQAFLPLLRKSQGRVVFMSSISGRVAAPLLGPYAASKFALEALADSMRREIMPWGIRVSIIQPGRIRTPIWEKSIAAADAMLERLPSQAQQLYGEMMAANRARALNNRGGAPVEAVARAVAHALTAANPRIRYLVGSDARLVAPFIYLLPAGWLDWLLARQRKIRR